MKESDDNIEEIVSESEDGVQYFSSEETPSGSSGNTQSTAKITKAFNGNVKTRNHSQPGPSPKIYGPKDRPSRSIATMDNMIFDPITKRFQQNNMDTNDTKENTCSQLPVICISENQYGDYRNQQYPIGNNDIKSINTDRRHKNSTAFSVTSMDYLDLQSTSSEKKQKNFNFMLTTVLSCMYGILLVTLGLILFIADLFVDTTLAENYCLYLVAIGIIYLLYLYVDIRIYIAKSHKYHEEKLEYNHIEELKKNNEIVIVPTYLKKDGKLSAPPVLDEHPYCFTMGRHAGSFYLKLGATAFFLGHLVHRILFFSLEIIYLKSEEDNGCGSYQVLVLNILYPIYSCFQLFFIVKYSNVIILKCKEFARFAMMHLIASNLCFWIWTIIKEILESLTIYAKRKAKKEDNSTDIYPDISDKYFNIEAPFSGAYLFRSIFNLTNLADDVCLSSHGFENVIENVFPYLYPFTIEFSILITGVFYILWHNIGECPKEEVDAHNDFSSKEDMNSYKSQTTECLLPAPINDNGISNMTVSIDCHSSNRGWFMGLIVLVVSIVSIIVTFITVSNENTVQIGVILKDASELTLHLIMLIAALIAYRQIKKLDINDHPMSLLDDVLLFICIPAFFMEAAFTTVPSAINLNLLKLFHALIMVIQVLIQTPLIIDALRRCSNSRKLRKLKPGRELITLLIVCNVATWIFETFSVKNAETNDDRYDFYGKALWTILGHMSTPLCMFYRFHSSVCLVDIWKHAYEPASGH